MFADRPMTSATGAITEDSAVARLPRAEGVTDPSGIRAAGVQLNTPSLAGTSSLSPSACEAFLGWMHRPFLIAASKKICINFISGLFTISSILFFFSRKGFTRASNIKNQSWSRLE